MAKLGEYANFIMGQAPASSECNTDGIGTPFVKAGQFGESVPEINEWTTNPLKLAEENDVLICVVGATSGKLNRGADCAIGRSVAAIRPNIKADRDYIYYGLHPWIMRLRNNSQGSAIGVITKDMLDAIEMPFPTINEQGDIVRKLQIAEQIICERKRELQLLDDLIKARFVELFGDTKYAVSRWGGKTIKDITINLDSKRKPVKESDRAQMQGEYPYYGATGIVDYVNDYRQDGTFLLISEDGKALEFRNKPIAFIASGKIWVNNHAHVQQCCEDCNMVYLMYYINLMDISPWVTGIDQKKLNRENLDSIQIGLPPIGLQEEFEQFAKQVDKSKVVVQKALDETQVLFDSLMQQYFG